MSDTQKLAFDCKMCGRCCEGLGGIILTQYDLQRLYEHMGLSKTEFIKSYAEMRNGKLGIKTGADGFCVFFEAGKGCAVHIAKPNVCRTWPFFRGNLVDEESLSLAKEYCPGITPDISFAEFQEQGKQYIKEFQLQAPAEKNAPNALKV